GRRGERPGRYRLNQLDTTPLLFSWERHWEPVIIEDAAEEEPWPNEELMQLFKERFGAGSMMAVPLVVGQQWVGAIHATYSQTKTFTEEEVQSLSALAGQAAIAIQSIHLLEEAQNRVRREQLLREVTETVRSVTDVELVMKTAAREVGRALGRDAFVYLGERGGKAEADDGAQQHAAHLPTGNGDSGGKIIASDADSPNGADAANGSAADADSVSADSVAKEVD
ncbi:MAG: GAF domain-containing protein, partial [Candidatus Promineifilaceae bacterium]|nr:GAF domain-containing protein [Candidatus Promineifilaceae bacterium]